MNTLKELFDAASPLLPGLVTSVCFILVLYFQQIRYRGQSIARKLRRPVFLFYLFIFIASLAVLGRLYLPGVWRFAYLTSIMLLALAIVWASTAILFDIVVGRRLKIAIPSILKSITMLLVFTTVVLFVLSSEGISVTSLVTTSAVFTAIIGFALQDLLSSMISGLAIQMETPYKEGDWVKFDQFEGCVKEINWRATKIETRGRDIVIIPNNMATRSPIINYSAPTSVHRRKITIGLKYEDRPAEVHRSLISAALSVPEVLRDPEPIVNTINFGDFSIEYELVYFITDLPRREIIDGLVRTRMWYRLERDGLRIPFPIQNLNVRQLSSTENETARQKMVVKISAVLKQIPEFSPLNDEDLLFLAQNARVMLFGVDETIIHQNEEGVALNIIAEGETRIVVHPPDPAPGDPGRTVATLGPGRYFGERALITGDPVSADAVAHTDCTIYQINKDALAVLLNRTPATVELLSQRLIERERERASVMDLSESDSFDAVKTNDSESGSIAVRIRQFFQIKTPD